MSLSRNTTWLMSAYNTPAVLSVFHQSDVSKRKDDSTVTSKIQGFIPGNLIVVSASVVATVAGAVLPLFAHLQHAACSRTLTQGDNRTSLTVRSESLR